jgi:hypothetical protein
LSSKLRSFKKGQGKKICAWPPTFGIESWRPSAKKFVSASFEALELQAWKFQERLRQFFLHLASLRMLEKQPNQEKCA